MIDPVTLSALAGSFANGFASALGSEAGKALFNGQCHCSREEEASRVFYIEEQMQQEAKTLVVTGWYKSGS